MLNGWWKGERAGSGTVVWWARQEHAAGHIDYKEFLEVVSSSAPSIGHCNTMGTASTMNALAEALGLSLPGCAAIPAPYRERAQIAYHTGRRAVEIVHEDLKPSDILTRRAFENAIVACSAIGGSTNAPIHINARGVTSLPCIGDGRQSGTSASPSILNASPEAAAGGGLALLETGDRVRIDLNKGTANILISDAELAERRLALQKRGGYPYPASQTPWQEIQRSMVDQLADGMVLKPAVKYQRVAQQSIPRDNH
jgi:dihydroxyacid dehydratase/phosphogluconate dehydratase